MAVIVKYVVERNGVETMTFASKREADAYDKQLDIADALKDCLAQGELGLSEPQLEAVAHYLAEQRERVGTLLKGGGHVVDEDKPRRGRRKRVDGEAAEVATST